QGRRERSGLPARARLRTRHRAACSRARRRRMSPFEPLTSAVRCARVGRDEQRDVVVAVLECDLDSDALEERRRRPEEEPVDTGLEPRGELADAAVAVGLTGGDELVLPELDADRAPDRAVRALAGGRLADVVPAEDGCAAARAEPQGVACGERLRAVARARNEQGLLDLEEEVAALVRRRAVDAEADAHARV